MADVSCIGDRRRQDRGQLLLVTGLSLAVLFVALALIVNTAIYTENLATRSSDIGGGTDAVRYHDATRNSVGGTIEYSNYHNNTSFSDLGSELRAGIDAYRNASGPQFALSDRVVEVELNETTNGTRVVQNNESRDFTGAGGATDWTVATDVNNVRAFRMHVFDTNLLGVFSNGFRVVLDDGSNTWTMTVYEPISSDIEVDIDGPTASGTCAVSASDAWINVSDGTVGGQPCDALTTMGDGLSSPYEVRFENAADGSGTYTFVVDNSTLATSPGPHLNSPGGGQPFATHAVYSATVDIGYQTPRLRYEAAIRIAPEEPE